MLTAIQFHDQLRILTEEIRIEPKYRNLPPELHPEQLTIPQEQPKPSLGLCFLTPKSSSNLCLRRSHCLKLFTPHPTLPHRERASDLPVVVVDGGAGPPN